MKKKLTNLFLDTQNQTLLLGFAFLSFFICTLVLYFQWSHLQSLSEEINTLYQKELLIYPQRKLVRELYFDPKGADPEVIEKIIENLQLREEETHLLAKICETPPGCQNTLLQKRWLFLKENNHLSFKVDKTRKGPIFQEFELHQQKPVDVDIKDLEKILSLIEKKTIGSYQPSKKSPQLIVQNFTLSRKKIGETGDTFVLHMNLLKRECLP
jgi:hypothetical protein